MIEKYKKHILIGILLLASLLRFYSLSDYPALNADEAAIGYNAYSLLETGKDEHGNPWPIHFQSFNDYKPGLYFYLVLPFVKFLGLNAWAVRIPGALFGVLSFYFVYLLVKELFKGKKLKVDLEAFSLTSAFFLAISPWHLHFSRGGWEVNVATFFIILGVYAFIKGVNEKSRNMFVVSAVSFVLSLYTYHAARVIVPLLGLGLKITYWRDIKKNFRKLAVAGVIGFILILPLARDLTTSGALSRAAGVGLLADPGPLNRINELRGQHEKFRGIKAQVLHNKAVNYSIAFWENWSEHFWGEFLFLSGDDIERNKVPETGVFYLFDIIFLIAGVWFISRKIKGWAPILIWVVVGPMAAALTFQSPHALRAQNLVIPMVIMSAFGMLSLLDWAGRYKKYLVILFSLLIVWNFARYQHMYWVHMAKEYKFSSQYGVEELVSYVKEVEDEHEAIVITDRYDQPYILFLFYMNYPPEKFQGEHVLTGRDEYGFSTVGSFNKYYFRNINFEEVRLEHPNSLIAGTPDEMPDEANVIKKIYGSNGLLYFDVVAN